MKSTLFIISFLVFNSTIKAQTPDFFGQNPPNDSAIVFAPGIVSTIHHEHSRIEFSKDGSAFYWAVIPVDTNNQINGESPFKADEQNIWYVKKKGTEWSTPEIFLFTKQIGGSNPAFSMDHTLFYFKSLIPDVDPNLRPKPSQLWRVELNDESSKKPVSIDNLIPVEKGKVCMSFCFASNGNLYFDYGGPDESGKWMWNIFLSELKDGAYQKPVLLNDKINGISMSWCPWIAPDESYIIYSSHREGEYGNGDLYINFKDEKGNWSEPINMGERVNTEMQERFPSVSPDGKYLFFARHVPDTYNDIYWIDAKIIEELKSKNLK